MGGVVVDDAERAVRAHDLTGETSITPERALVGDEHLDRGTHRKALCDLIASDRNRRLVFDVSRKHRRGCDDGIPATNRLRVGHRIHALTALHEPANREPKRHEVPQLLRERE